LSVFFRDCPERRSPPPLVRKGRAEDDTRVGTLERSVKAYSPKKKRATKKRKRVARKSEPEKKRKKRPGAVKKRSTGKKRTAVKKRSTGKKRPAGKKRSTAKKRAASARKPTPKKRALGGRKRPKGEILSKLEKSIQKERYKLRTKKWASTPKKRKRLRKKISRLEEQKKEIVAPKPEGTPAQKKLDRNEQIAHYKEVFGELLDIARKEKKLPKIDYRLRKVDSQDRLGEKRAVRVEVLLEGVGVEEALYAIEQTAAGMSGLYHIWLCNFVLAGMGETIIGYGNRVLDAHHPDAHAFQMAFDSTGIYTSREGMLLKAREVLEGYAGELYTMVYLIGFTVQNFSFKIRE
jgi:hypothetical protein